MERRIFNFFSKLICFFMFFVFAALLTVIIGVNNASESTELTASAGSYNNGKDGLWPATATEPGTYWLNNYCNTNWYMYMSDGASGDNASNTTECKVDQGASTDSRNCYHQIRVPFGSELTSCMASQNFTFTFSGDMCAANPDYNTIRLYLEFLNSSGGVIASTSAAVWGKDGGGGSTDTYSYESISYTTNNLSGCVSLRITVRDDKVGTSIFSPRHMDLFLRNHRLVITCNTSLYNAGYVNYGSQVTDITDGHLIATTGTMNCNGVTKYGWQATGVANDNPRITLSASSMPVAAGVTYTMTALYYSSTGNLDDVYLSFGGVGGYPEGNLYLRPFEHGFNLMMDSIGGNWYRLAGSFTTTTGTSQISWMFFDSDVAGQVLFICDISITQGSNPITAGSGTINARNINVAGSGINTTYASISTNAWCPPMSNSSTTGSPAANYSPTGPSISSLGGSAPAMVTPAEIAVPAYVNGMFTPTMTGASVPILATSVGDISPEAIINYSGVGTVPTSSDSYSALAVYAANPNSPNVVVSSLGAQQPADAYSFSNVVYQYYYNNNNPRINANYSYSDDYDWSDTGRIKTWTITSSGLLDINMVGTDSGLFDNDDNVQINFETGGTDMHIVLMPGRNIGWYNDRQSRLNVNGGGRVFLYLMGNNRLTFGNEASYISGTEDEMSRVGSENQLYIIGVGGSNYISFYEIKVRSIIYMPNGLEASGSAGRNSVKFISSGSNKTIKGIVVADNVSFTNSGKYLFYKEESGVTYGLPNYITFAGQSRPLSYFLINEEEENNYNYSWEEIDTYRN